MNFANPGYDMVKMENNCEMENSVLAESLKKPIESKESEKTDYGKVKQEVQDTQSSNGSLPQM